MCVSACVVCRGCLLVDLLYVCLNVWFVGVCIRCGARCVVRAWLVLFFVFFGVRAGSGVFVVCGCSGACRLLCCVFVWCMRVCWLCVWWCWLCGWSFVVMFAVCEFVCCGVLVLCVCCMFRLVYVLVI